MSKVNGLFQDEQERLMAEWLKAHPGATEEDAYYAINPDEPPVPLYPWGEEP